MEQDTVTGTLYGIGLGPGDPDLMTVKAHRLISSAKVVAYPAPDSGDSFARSIAADVISGSAIEIPIVIPMRVQRFPAQAVYDEAAATIGAHLDNGTDVAVLCEGDPFFYGSFMYLFGRLAEDHKTEIVPGVTSMTACAAMAARPLCARNEVLTVIPAPIDEALLRERLQSCGAAVIMKVGRHIAKVRKVIDELRLTDRAVYVGHASLPQQAVVPLTDAPETAPYFSIILIGGTDPYAQS